MPTDINEIDAMNKRELVAELKSHGLAYSGNKSECKIRLRNHLQKTVVTASDDEGEDDNDDEIDDEEMSANEGEMNDTLSQMERLQKEVRERLDAMEELRQHAHSSTR